MNWNHDSQRMESTSDRAYQIRWARVARGWWYTAYTPGGRLLHAGAEMVTSVRFCEEHFARGDRRGKPKPKEKFAEA